MKRNEGTESVDWRPSCNGVVGNNVGCELWWGKLEAPHLPRQTSCPVSVSLRAITDDSRRTHQKVRTATSRSVAPEYTPLDRNSLALHLTTQANMRLFLCCGVYVHVPFTKKKETSHIPGTAAHELGQPSAIDPRTGRARNDLKI